MPFSSSGFDWGNIPGLQKVKTTLEKFITSERIPQAIILSGKAGIGKDFLASAFAKHLNKDWQGSTHFSAPHLLYVFPLPLGKAEGSDDDPYEKLHDHVYDEVVDQLEQKNRNPYHKIFIDAPTSIKINSIRSIGKFLNLYTFEEKIHRVIIISQADRMGDPSQNALLKSLEEPPENVTFILTTDSPEVLKETIRSRCWEIQCPPLSESEVEEVLINYFEVEPVVAGETSRFAMGSPDFAINLIEMDYRKFVSALFEFLRQCIVKRYFSAVLQLKEIQPEADSDSFLLFLKMLQFWFYDLEQTRLTGECRYFVEHKDVFAKFLGAHKGVTGEAILPYLDELENKISRRNANLPVCLLNLMIRISEVITPLN